MGERFHICFLGCQLDWTKRGLGPLCVGGGAFSVMIDRLHTRLGGAGEGRKLGQAV